MTDRQEPSAAGPGPPDDAAPADPAARGTAGTPGSARPPRNRTARFAWGSLAVILVAVIGLVTYALTDPPVTLETVQRTTAAPEVVAQLAKVPASVFDTVGVAAPDTTLAAPAVLSGQPPLQSAGKPEVLYVGAEYCPFCAAERWPLIVALSRFGRFTGLKNMQSAPLSVFPGTQTFSFVGAGYASRYLAFSGVELYSDAVDGRGSFARIATLTPVQAFTVARYGGRSAGRGRIGHLPVRRRRQPHGHDHLGLQPRRPDQAVPGGHCRGPEPGGQSDHPGRGGLGQSTDRRDVCGHRAAARLGLHQQGCPRRRGLARDGLVQARLGRRPGRRRAGLSRPAGQRSACAPSR